MALPPRIRRDEPDATVPGEAGGSPAAASRSTEGPSGAKRRRSTAFGMVQHRSRALTVAMSRATLSEIAMAPAARDAHMPRSRALTARDEA